MYEEGYGSSDTATNAAHGNPADCRRSWRSDVRVFGAVARDDSDLDVLITLEPGRSLLDIVALKQELEDLVICNADVVTEGTLSP